MKKRMKQFVFVFLWLFLLVGCKEQTETTKTYTVTLRNTDGSIYSQTEVLALETFTPPVLEEDGLIFIGWQSASMIYYDTFEVIVNYDLTATFEDPIDVFDYRLISDEEIEINGYQGDALVLKIPSIIDGLIVKGIGASAFSDSTLEGVYIPNTVELLSDYAFHNAKELAFVTYYGDYFGTEERIVSKSEYEETLEEYSEVCTIETSGDGVDVHTFSEGCPYQESKGHTGEVTIGGVTYYSVIVVVDYQYTDDYSTQRIRPHAFDGADALKEVTLPARLSYFTGEVFSGAINIEAVYIPDNATHYMSIDGILYSNTMSQLMYYPSALTAKSFTIPDTVSFVYPLAFNQNRFLETIYIGPNLSSIATVYQMTALKAFVVDEANEDLLSDEGVLYTTDLHLLVYPAAKTDRSYEVLEGTISVQAFAFGFNQYLTQLILGDDLDYIGSKAFFYSENLETLWIPNTADVVYIDLAVNSQIEDIVVYDTEAEGVVFFQYANVDPRTPQERYENAPLPEKLLPDFYFPDDEYGAYVAQFIETPIVAYVQDNFYLLSEYSD